MDWASIYYLGVTIGLFLIFAVIVARTYSKKHKARGEEPKYRMMDDDDENDSDDENRPSGNK